jgi:hypothetical protein
VFEILGRLEDLKAELVELKSTALITSTKFIAEGLKVWQG